MDVTISPGPVGGTVPAPPSKSYTHRAILAAGCGQRAVVADPLWSADTRATARAVEAFGGAVERRTDGALEIQGFEGTPAVPADVIDCANSGTTMRLVTAIAALADGTTVLTGDESLRSRPQGPLLDALSELGATARSTRGNGQAPLIVDGSMAGGTVSIPGDVSSQYVTALLVAGALTDAGIDLRLETELKSAPYVEVTRELLADFGVETRETADGFAVAGGQSYHPADDTYAVPGDFSSISYLLAAGAVAGGDASGATAGTGEGTLEITGARPSAQGDSAIVEHVAEFGAPVEWDRDDGTLTIDPAPLSGIEVSVADTPDLLPTLAVLGAVADGETSIVDAEHVRYKETDRIDAMASELAKLGVETTEERDSLTVHGDESTLTGATVDGHGDHRIVMALAVAALVADGETTIRGAEHVDVSFPDFFDAFESLGVVVDRHE
ncbi:3-phosphoshikimate 1-carboxyvinyltransferase [Halovivax asiaticus JCM 14624]|uniref:3-phosphoshikimate 1-carboxyvinyltransferase n=1 Tax=Halovivax asiaticus JCM 14624 TaxID=1227490 RepID=M0BR70_9EURY|nr:3-phosphoshikimate 1-carboxyvinyltransferase [Halovivax asiaticus]ELZ12602.1 3-phosphoshikimate 1-carboxyvinyltransferase [Halovivax asiaticus JCM 14624]